MKNGRRHRRLIRQPLAGAAVLGAHLAGFSIAAGLMAGLATLLALLGQLLFGA